MFTGYKEIIGVTPEFSREDIVTMFPETKMFLQEEDNTMLRFGNDGYSYDDEEREEFYKTMGIIVFQLCIEMTM